VLDDAKSLVLAKAGREDFVNPEGAPIVYTLRQAGWTNLVDIDDLIKHGPGGVDSPIEPLIGIVGIGQFRLRQQPPEHCLALPFGRVAVIDATKKDPSLYDLQAPYLNSMAGRVSMARRRGYVSILHPFTTFDDNKHTTTTRQVRPTTPTSGTHTSKLRRDSIIPPEVQPTTRVGGRSGARWWTTGEDRRILKKLSGATLTPDKQKLVDQAKTFYADYDFLDAYSRTGRFELTEEPRR